MHEVYQRLLAMGHTLVSEDEFMDAIEEAAENTASSARTQVALALGLAMLPALLANQIDALVAGIRQRTEQAVVDSMARAANVFRDWQDTEDEDADALDGKLDDGLGGILGGAVAGAGLIFGAVWADMNRETQASAGVTSAVWVAQRDKFTRPAHAALDEKVFRWDSPPLKASESSNGQDCFPGDDFGCRCLAAPLN